jgi:rhodanese-related sulfurtransferase
VAQPSARTTIDTLLNEARRSLHRLEPHAAQDAMADGAMLIDIRTEVQHAADGVVPGAVLVPRNVLEWRCDPSCAAHDPRIGGLDRRLIVMCNQGYGSRLAAGTLQQLGFARATDLVGGFQAWRAAGLPAHPVTPETVLRAVDCACGDHLEADDDEQLLRLAREHIEREHPEMRRSDEQLRYRIAADGYDLRSPQGGDASAAGSASHRLARWGHSSTSMSTS